MFNVSDTLVHYQLLSLQNGTGADDCRMWRVLCVEEKEDGTVAADRAVSYNADVLLSTDIG